MSGLNHSVMLAWCVGASASGALALDYAQFAAPPREHHPEAWVYFIGGNIAKPGITADMEAIRSAGISGIQLFHGKIKNPEFPDVWPGVERQLQCLSPEWENVIGFTADECVRLGLGFKMQNCPGWATSGGPWIAPSNAMRSLVFSRLDIDGGREQTAALPLPKPSDEEWRDYRDIAVLAFPTPLGDTGKDAVPVKREGALAEACSGKSVEIPAAKADAPHRATVTFAEPLTLRTVTIPSASVMNHPRSYNPDTRVSVEALENGAWRVVADQELPQGCWLDIEPQSIALDEATAAQWRINFYNRIPLKVRYIRFSTAARLNNWEGLSAKTLRGLVRGRVRQQRAETWIGPQFVRELSGQMDSAGTLRWNAPEGRWTILRFGHVNAGARNSPAPDEATGWECDKMNTSGIEANFNAYIGRLNSSILKGGKLQGMLTDSWECGRQTWARGLEKEFQQRRGYSPISRLPALFGWVVGNPDETERFLLDWRRTCGELINERYYARMAALAHDAGLRVQYETSFGDVVPGDIMEYWKYADEPMCEFWNPHGDGFVGEYDFKPVRPCVSSARMYGKRRVAAESFTEMFIKWDETPRALKYLGNIHLARGVTHLVYQTYTHNPVTNGLPPGSSFGTHIGTPFLRENTWWPVMQSLTEYFARCETLLESGKPVSDILWFLGDELGHKPLENHSPFPAGFNYDYVNPDALLRRISVRGGQLITPDGIAYPLLWVPDSERMQVESLERILALAEAGASVAFERLPLSRATLGGDAAEEGRFRTALQKLSSQPRVFIGKPIENVLRTLHLKPDVTGAEDIAFQHRRDAQSDWYFVTSDNPGGWRGKLSFRASGHASLWNPLDGKVYRLAAHNTDAGRTEIELDLPPSGAHFIVFERQKRQRLAEATLLAHDRGGEAAAQPNGWRVSFPGGWGMPAEMAITNLASWSELGPTDEAKAFSGTARYETSFKLGDFSPDRALVLDLGRVECAAKVWVNGKEAGTLWCEPYCCDIAPFVRAGENTLSIEVTGTWFNRLAYDTAQPPEKRKTWTTWYCTREKPRPSGLLGPVLLRTRR